MPLTQNSFTPDEQYPVTKDTNYFIPEFSSSKEERLADLNAKAKERGAGTVWSLDQNGNFVATNTPETRKKGTLGYGSKAEIPATSPAIGSLNEQMKAIEAMPVDQRIKGLIDLQGTVQLFASQRKEQARLKAEAELGTDNLKKMLEASMQDDRRYPQFAKYGTYSAETENLRANYQAALLQAQNRTNTLLSEDSELTAVVKKAELFSTFQESEITASQSRATKLAEVADGIKKVASWVQGRPATDTDILKNYQKFATYEALSNNPAALLEQTIINKDPGAASILAHVQASAVAKTSDETSPVYEKVYEKTRKEIALMSGIMTDNNMFEEIFKESYPKDVDGQQKAAAALLLLRQAPKEYELMRKQVAQSFIQSGAKRDFEENVGDWIMASTDGQLINPFGVEGTPLHTVFVAAKGKGKTVSLQALVAEIKALPPQQSTAAMEELRAAMQNAYEHSSGGVYGRSGDSLDMDMLLNEKIVKNSFLAGVGTELTRAPIGAFTAGSLAETSAWIQDIFGNQEGAQ